MWRRSSFCLVVGCGPAICANSSASAVRPSNCRRLPRAFLRNWPPMYVYDAFDRALVTQRAAEFPDQVARRLSGELREEEFKPLRLLNGVYLQLHAYMLRTAIPYGNLSSEQMSM